jgi:hypothetical protein
MANKQVLIHYSDKVLERVFSRDQEAPTSYFDKPRGLWVSVKGKRDWLLCCTEARFQYAHEIELTPTARLYRIRSARALDKFTEAFGVPPLLTGGGMRDLPAIDWPRLAKRFQGIVIAPYIWSRRMHMESSWYYRWDCASGCIWDAGAVAGVHLLEKETSHC